LLALLSPPPLAYCSLTHTYRERERERASERERDAPGVCSKEGRLLHLSGKTCCARACVRVRACVRGNPTSRPSLSPSCVTISFSLTRHSLSLTYAQMTERVSVRVSGVGRRGLGRRGLGRRGLGRRGLGRRDLGLRNLGFRVSDFGFRV